MTQKKPTNKELDSVVNYMAIEIGYSDHIILPYDAGVAFLSALRNAEFIKGSSYDFDKGKFEFHPGKSLSTTIIPQTTYRKVKMAQLLGLNEEEESDD